jgi:hypothetical protein
MATSEAKHLAAAPKKVRSLSPRCERAVRRVGQLPCGLQLHRHVGEHELDALELGDRLAELLALLDIAGGVVERALGDAQRLGGDGDPGVVEGLHRRGEAGALLADHAVGGDADVVEVDLAGRRALDAELLLGGAEGHALVALLDDERRDALAALLGVGHGHDRVELADAGVGDPALHAVQHPEVAVAHRAGLHPGRVGTGVRLREAVGEHALAPGQRAQVLLLERLAAGDLHGQRAQLVDGRDERGRDADPRHLLDQDDGGQRVRARAAVGLRDVDGVQVVRQQRVQCLLREAGLLVDLGRERGDLRLGQRPDGVAEHLVLLRDPEQVEVRRTVGIAGRHASHPKVIYR